jgi:putative membrane protein insertion efficiency factor
MDSGLGPLARPGMTAQENLMPIESLFEAARDAPRLAGRAFIKAYRYTLSPLIGFDCRHLPTCSEYADQAVERYGLWAGSWMTLARLLRCHPFGTRGLDFVPATLPPNARWYMPWRFARWRGTNPGPPAPVPAAPGAAGKITDYKPPGQLTCARPQE